MPMDAALPLGWRANFSYIPETSIKREYCLDLFKDIQAAKRDSFDLEELF